MKLIVSSSSVFILDDMGVDTGIKDKWFYVDNFQ